MVHGFDQNHGIQTKKPVPRFLPIPSYISGLLRSCACTRKVRQEGHALLDRACQFVGIWPLRDLLMNFPSCKTSKGVGSHCKSIVICLEASDPRKETHAYEQPTSTKGTSLPGRTFQTAGRSKSLLRNRKATSTNDCSAPWPCLSSAKQTLLRRAGWCVNCCLYQVQGKYLITLTSFCG